MDNKDCQVLIKFSDIQEVQAFKNSIMGVLSKVEIDRCDKVLINDLKSVYKLLDQLSTHQTIAVP
ncbi:hypothetical protein [Aquimarina algicola]|uniref:Uncharacterized protein n=1 Tax=Aquimarina algicola TaxID=2589995 RepID=A0A504JND3_9FLAO|nr:hypothetical protein [Aquimarina algicola]TPN87930.1 hypothetical protein FHK87_10175 [Aquimarina algicola]